MLINFDILLQNIQYDIILLKGMSQEQQVGKMEKYQLISKLYKEIVDTITGQEIGQIKLYFVNLEKKIKEKVQDLYSQYKDVSDLLNNLQEAKGKYPIHYAVASGNLEVTKYLIDILKADHQIKDKEGNTPFFTAVEHGAFQIVKYFINELKISPHIVKEGEINALHIAANHNHINIIKFLIDEGCDYEKMSIYGKPINWAVGNRHLQATKMLLEHGADANGDPTCPAPPPLILAIDFNCRQIYDALLNAPLPANFNAQDAQGFTALHVAAEKGSLEIVKDLVQKGAEPNTSIKGKTPLYLAFQNSKWEVVAYLRTLTKNYEQIESKVKQAIQKKEEQLKAHPVNKEKAEEIKLQGNKFYSQKKYEEALEKYSEALVHDSENEIIHRNMAACYLPLHKYKQALQHCHKAKMVDGKNVKTLYREAQAYIGLGELIEAASSLWECYMLEPQTLFFKQEFEKYVALAKQKHASQ